MGRIGFSKRILKKSE